MKSPVLNDHFFFVLKVTSEYRFDCSYMSQDVTRTLYSQENIFIVSVLEEAMENFHLTSYV
jgi:hypothetical protein